MLRDLSLLLPLFSILTAPAAGQVKTSVSGTGESRPVQVQVRSGIETGSIGGIGLSGPYLVSPLKVPVDAPGVQESRHAAIEPGQVFVGALTTPLAILPELAPQQKPPEEFTGPDAGPKAESLLSANGLETEAASVSKSKAGGPDPNLTPHGVKLMEKAQATAGHLKGQDRTLSWSEIEEVVKFGRRPGEAGSDQPARAAEVEVFSRQALSRMQETPEGREVLRQLVREYGRQGKTVVISAQAMPGSSILLKNGMQTVNGIRGQTSTWDLYYKFNELYLQFQDRAHAVETLAGNMAHEFRHLVSASVVGRMGRLDTFVDSFIDEQRARITGYLVAMRLNTGKPSSYMKEAAKLAKDPKGFWGGLQRLSAYARLLDGDEMKDPAAAYRRRIQALTKRQQGYRAALAQLPRMDLALDIMTRQESLGSEADELRSQVLTQSRRFSAELKRCDEIIAMLEGALADFENPDAQTLFALARMEKASDSEAYQILLADQERDHRTLVDLVRSKTIPVAQRPPGMLDWPRFWEKVRESRRKHPESWTDFVRKFGEPGAD